ncbi:hypothetical protein LTR29_000029 [Friedmanniomyces endolithicus]|nr:hypothetical protein LTR29_000029 [Friedmanniomyces endolithicus]
MMAAYQPQPIHPGMNPHGHPSGMPPNMQHMGQQMMQPGVSGPGQAQMSQAGAMMGMSAMQSGQHAVGGMPQNQGMGGQSMPGQNPQAMNHMTPQQMMQHQQMQQMQQNPQMAMQHQQRLLQQHAMRNMQAAHANGMMGMQQAGMQGLTQQQIGAMLQQQSNAGAHPGAVQLPPHMQQQLMQQRAIQQQAQQNHQAQLHQQQIAMQQANSQQSNQGQPGPPSQQVQQAGPPQMRPQSRMANTNEQTPGSQQQHPQQVHQSQSQQGTPQQSQQPNPQQVQQPMNPQQIQQVQQQQRMAMMHRQQQQHIHAQRVQQAREQQAQAQAQQQQQMQSGALILRLNLLCDHLSNFNLANGKDLNSWNDFVDKHFAPEGRLLHSFDEPNKAKKTYEVLRPTIARYFFTYFESGAQSLRLHIEHAREVPLGGNRFQVSCSHATLAVAYPSGARLEMTGSLNVLFVPVSNIIECLEMQQTGTEESLSRSEIERVLSSWSPVMENKSPKLAKNKLPKAQQKLQQRFDGLTIDHFPKAPKGNMGVTSRVQQFLEIGETMNFMTELMQLSQDRQLRPEQALDAWAASQQQHDQGPVPGGNPQVHMLPNGVPMGNRTPSMGHMPIPPGNLSSPAMGNMGLPMQQPGVGGGPLMNGSPHIANMNHPGGGGGQLAPNMHPQPNSHTPSPRQSNMAAPPMVPQHSQQGTNSSAASANTSPQVNNKRRRSTVKVEEDGQEAVGPPVAGGGQKAAKNTPRMTKKGKPGGAG